MVRRARGVDMAGKFESFRVDKINVGGGNGKNYAVGLCYILRDQVAGLLLDVCRLVADGDFGQTRQVYQGEVQNMRGIYLEVDGLPVDAFIHAGDPGRFVLDLALDIRKVREAPFRNVVELCPLALPCSARVKRMVRIRRWRVILVYGHVDELENQRTTRDDARAARKEISADDVFKYRGLSCRLRANNNLR